jgi:hypothetical protein
MRGETHRTSPEALLECWSRWTAIVALFARRRAGRRWIDPGTYAALRADLMGACRSRAEADVQKRGYYLGLEEMVRPWIDLRVLDRTDREILAVLLRRCREVERQLAGRRWSLHWLSDIGPAPVTAFLVLAVAACVALIMPLFGYSPIETVRDVTLTAWLHFKYADDFYKMCGLALIVIGGAIYVVSRSAQSWR